jgi:drug/metabolite transporter (DMT)-like permease
MKLREGFFEVLLASFLWGTVGVAIEYFYDLGSSPYSLVFFRTLISGIISFFLVDLKVLTKGEGILMGLISAFFYELYALAVTIDGASLATVLLFTSPLWVTLISWRLVKEGITAIKVISSLLIISGVYLMYLGTGTILQIAIGLASGLIYGLLISYSRLLQVKQYKEKEIIAFQSIWGMPFVLPFLRGVNLPSLYGGVYLALFASIIPYYFFYRGMKKSDSVTATIISSMEPVFTIAIAIPLLKEHLNGLQLLGASIIIASVMINGIIKR